MDNRVQLRTGEATTGEVLLVLFAPLLALSLALAPLALLAWLAARRRH